MNNREDLYTRGEIILQSQTILQINNGILKTVHFHDEILEFKVKMD
jgi:hypothetical protein